MTTTPSHLTASPWAPGPSPGERPLLAEVLNVVRRHLNMDVAFLGRFEDGRRHFAHVDTVAGFHPIRAGDSDPLEDSYCGRVLAGRIPALIVDARTEPAVADLAATTLLPIGTHLSVPVYTGDDLYGTLCCFSRTVHADASPADLATLRMFADIVSTHLQPLVDRERQTAAQQGLLGQLLDDGGPAIVVQPVVDLTTGRVAGYEALSRFPHRAGWGPPQWFAAAHHVGLGVALESAAIHNALKLLTVLPEDVCLSVNVSARALLASGSIPTLLSGQTGERLIVEITEHEQVRDTPHLQAALAVVRAAGTRVAVDDAGSGFAGLEHILTLAPEVLKLDRALIAGIGSDPARQALCEAMVGFARRVGATVVAEGVETTTDLDTLRALGVTHAQGYLLGRPAPYPPPDDPTTAVGPPR